MAFDLMDKIGKLARLAEEASTQEEAEAFAAKAQALATASQIDLAEARRRTAKAEQREQPEVRRITLGESGTKGLKYFVSLYTVIAAPNEVKINIAHNSTYVQAFGMPSDIDVVNALYGSLVTQMVAAANSWLRTGEYKKDSQYVEETFDWRTATWRGGSYKPVDGRIARGSFYDGFTSAIGSRLIKARKEAIEATRTESDGEEAETSGALVLRDKALEIRDFYKEKSTARGSYRPSSSKGYSTAGSTAGRSAGTKATLGSRPAIGGGRTAIH